MFSAPAGRRKRTPDLSGIVTCKIDGTRLRVPVDKCLVGVRCPRCQYEFQLNTSVPDLPPPDAPKSLWQRLSGLRRTGE